MIKNETKAHGFLFWVLTLGSAFFSCIFILTDRSLEVTSAADMLKAMNGANLEALCCIILGILVFKRVYGIRNRRAAGFAILGSAVFTLCDLIGYNIYFRDSLTRSSTSLFSLALDLSCGLGAFFLFFGLLFLLFDAVTRHRITPRETNWSQRWFSCNVRSMILYFSFPMVLSLGLLFFFYPGIMTWDSFVQIKEGLGLFPLSDRNPFLHTLLMKYVIRLGTLIFGTITRGIAFYTAFQSFLIALAISFVMLYMARRKLHFGLRLGTYLYLVLHPAIACYSVTLWKDIWLSYFLLLYVLLLIEIALNPENFLKRTHHLVILALVILGFLFSKNTGIIVLAGTLPFVLICGRKHWKPLVLTFLVCLMVLGFFRQVLLPQMGVIKGSISETLSVPIQQLARTRIYEEESLTDEQIIGISELLPYDWLPEIYQPGLSDDVKREFDTEVFSSDPMHYIKFWAQLGAAYPRTYAESFLANSCGYWYPDVIYWHIASAFQFSGIDPVPNPGQEAVALRQNYFIHLYEQLQIVPGIATLLTTAAYFWGCFLLTLIALLKKKYRMLLPLLVPFLTWIICILSPSIAEFRYAFPAVLSLPLLASFLLQDDTCLTESLGLTGAKRHGVK